MAGGDRIPMVPFRIIVTWQWADRFHNVPLLEGCHYLRGWGTGLRKKTLPQFCDPANQPDMILQICPPTFPFTTQVAYNFAKYSK